MDGNLDYEISEPIWGMCQDSRIEIINFNKKAVWQGIKTITPDDDREQVLTYNLNEKNWNMSTYVYTNKRSGNVTNEKNV